MVHLPVAQQRRKDLGDLFDMLAAVLRDALIKKRQPIRCFRLFTGQQAQIEPSVCRPAARLLDRWFTTGPERAGIILEQEITIAQTVIDSRILRALALFLDQHSDQSLNG